MSEWRDIETAPKDAYILLFNPEAPDWDGNMDVGRWYGSDDGGFWSCGGPNGGLELDYPFSHWMPLPEPPEP